MKEGDKVWVEGHVTRDESTDDDGTPIRRVIICDWMDDAWFAERELIPAAGKVIVSEKRLRALENLAKAAAGLSDRLWNDSRAGKEPSALCLDLDEALDAVKEAE